MSRAGSRPSSLGERDRLRFDYRSIREYITLKDDHGSVVMLAEMSTFNVIRTSASLCMQVDAIGGIAVLV
jgi:hypothetical protein